MGGDGSGVGGDGMGVGGDGSRRGWEGSRRGWEGNSLCVFLFLIILNFLWKDFSKCDCVQERPGGGYMRTGNSTCGVRRRLVVVRGY